MILTGLQGRWSRLCFGLAQDLDRFRALGGLMSSDVDVLEKNVKLFPQFEFNKDPILLLDYSYGIALSLVKWQSIYHFTSILRS